MSEEWIRDPAAWAARSLAERLEALREHYCTGPCGQSSSVMATRSAADGAFREAIEAARTPGPATAYVARKFRCRMEHDLSIGASDGGDHDEFTAIFTNAEARAFIAEHEAARTLPADRLAAMKAEEEAEHEAGKGVGG